jgi:dGTPase
MVLSANSFYSGFDLETIGGDAPRADEYRSVFQIHRDRILHTSSFRRLQGKTQVFLTGEYDFYRTRLTHSLEVSQIGRSLCAALQHRSPHLNRAFFIDPDLVEAACLAHDLGHPPFGHAGERSLHRLMAGDGGFEGNAQTLRLLTETIFAGGTRGLNPSRALLDAIMKYKCLRRDRPEAPNHFLYDGQAPYLDFVHGGGAARPEAGGDDMRSIECQVMDWADDTAYSLNDIADGVAAGFITIDRLERWAEGAGLDPGEADHLTGLLRALRERRVEVRANRKIGDFIAACSLAPRENPLAARTARHAFRLVIAGEVQAECALYKRLAVDLVFRSPQLQQLDFKADRILGQLFAALADNYLGAARPLQLLPPDLEASLSGADEGEWRRRLCDLLASLTDASAIRLHRRLLEPSFSGLSELL